MEFFQNSKGQDPGHCARGCGVKELSVWEGGARAGGGLRAPSELEVKIQGVGPSLSPLWMGMTKKLVGEVHWKAGKKPGFRERR